MSQVREQIDVLRPLLDNHLAFIATHRGAVRYRDNAVEVVGDADFLSCWIPTEENADVPDGAHAVRSVPWSGDGWPARLRAKGFEPAEVLLYMEAPLDATSADISDDVIEVTSSTDALAFADAQANGFLEQTDEESSWWRSTFERMALKNYRDPNQSFYLIRADGIPAAVTLAVRTKGVCGIYAVTTRPEFRRRGFGSRLLAHARHDAVERGGERLTLQVFEGSYAERLYRKLGFTLAFRSPAYRRSAPSSR